MKIKASDAKVIDAIGIAIIMVGLVMTVLLYFANRQPPFDIESFTLQEIPSPQPDRPAPEGIRPL